MKLILASTSSYRKTILSRTGIEFQAYGSDFDERSLDHMFQEDPGNCAAAIAYGKAQAMSEWLEAGDKDTWVLGADQIVWRQDGVGKIQFHKPGTEEAAFKQLMQISGHPIYSTTGLALVGDEGRTVKKTFTTETLVARTFSSKEARAYVEKYKPLNCAGSFRMEDAGITLFSRIEGDWTGCQGLPILTVLRMLRQVGFLPA